MKRIALIIVTMTTGTMFSQRLYVEHDGGTESFSVGEYISIAYQFMTDKSKHKVYQGLITEIDSEKNIIKIKDYANTARMFPGAAKKFEVDRIIGYERPDTVLMRQRQAVGKAMNELAWTGALTGGFAQQGSYASTLGASMTGAAITQASINDVMTQSYLQPPFGRISVYIN